MTNRGSLLAPDMIASRMGPTEWSRDADMADDARVSFPPQTYLCALGSAAPILAGRLPFVRGWSGSRRWTKLGAHMLRP